MGMINAVEKPLDTTNLRTNQMKSNDLFSHPYVSEAATKAEHDSAPVQAPVFSDSDAEKKRTAVRSGS
ncbi:hypothetical protein Mycsm_00766 [Mycobacterium sp. JS623]|nr:hypothetical protein Mycsm_00766 [Mycobacterium sp. JS623]